MEENSKLFVFEKKEVILILIFIVMIAAIAFTLGVKTGKGLSLKKDNYTQDDIAEVDLKSITEEELDGVVPKDETIADKQLEIEMRLKNEMEKLAKGDTKIEKPVAQMKPKKEVALEVIEESTPKIEDVYNQDKNYRGRFTIQLYSSQSEEAAKDFADAFIVKGYDVIINQVDIAGKGTWYRVSIGAFETTDKAREYLEKEKTLFRGNSYIIQNL